MDGNLDFANFYHICPPLPYMVGKLWISASIWHRAIEIWRILPPVRILMTRWNRNVSLIWELVIYKFSNLKRTNSSFVLRNYFFCILDADWNGNLNETKKENFVFVKLLKSVGRGQKLATQKIQQTLSLGACLQIFEKSAHLLIFFLQKARVCKFYCLKNKN